MEIAEEGLNVYTISEYTDNPYFISVEYPTLRHNKPKSFLPLLVRDQDGKKTIYYEITGKISLADRGEHGALTFRECYQILDGFYMLYEDIEEYMLSIRQVSFRKDDIYLDTEGHVQWIYLAVSEENTHDLIRELFLWILSIVDYEDKKALDLIYQFFDHIKKDAINKEFLAELLAKSDSADSKIPQKSSEEEEWSSELDFPLFEDSTDPPARAQDHKKDKEKKIKRKLSFKRLLAVAFFVITLLSAGYVGYCIYLRGTKTFLVVCFLILVILSGVMLRLVFAVDKKQDRSDDRKKTDYSPASGIYDMEDIYQDSSDQRSIFEKLEDHWESGDETMLISTDWKRKNPTLRAEGEDTSVEIRVFPFHIGSESGLNQLPLHNRAVSRQHAVILRGEGDQYFLEDMNSKNGTIVDGKEVVPEKPVPLSDGSRILFANEGWVFSL